MTMWGINFLHWPQHDGVTGSNGDRKLFLENFKCWPVQVAVVSGLDDSFMVSLHNMDLSIWDLYYGD